MSDFDTVLERLLGDPAFKSRFESDPRGALAGYRLSPDEAELLLSQYAGDAGGEHRVEQRTSKASLFGLASSFGGMGGGGGGYGGGGAAAASVQGAGGHGGLSGAIGHGGYPEAPGHGGLSEAGGHGGFSQAVGHFGQHPHDQVEQQLSAAREAADSAHSALHQALDPHQGLSAAPQSSEYLSAAPPASEYLSAAPPASEYLSAAPEAPSDASEFLGAAPEPRGGGMIGDSLLQPHQPAHGPLGGVHIDPVRPVGDYHARVDVEGDGHWDAHTYTARSDGGVDIVVDANHDGRADFVGVDHDRDGLIDESYVDYNHDGQMDAHYVDTNHDGWLDKKAPLDRTQGTTYVSRHASRSDE